MSKTKKNKIHKKNKSVKQSKKNNNYHDVCPINLKHFEEKFSGKLSTKTLIKSNKDKKKEFVNEIKAKFIPKSIKPNDDFYSYINYLWLKNVSLDKQQKYITRIDNFRLSQDKVYHQLNTIILDYIKNNNNKLSRNLKNYYTSIIKGNPTHYSKKIAFDSIKLIDKLIEENNPYKLLAYLNKNEMISPYLPLSWSISPDAKNNKIYRSFISPATFDILDLNIYFEDNNNYSKNYKEAFIKYVKQIFDKLLGLNHNYNVEDVFNVQKQIINSYSCIKELNNNDGRDMISYNKINIKDSLNLYNFDWNEFSKQLGFKRTPEFFFVGNKDYFRCCSELIIKNWKSKEWKTFWLFNIFKSLVRITKSMEKITYDFKGKFERAQEVLNETDAVSASLYMSIPFNTFLTNEYVKKYENKQVLEYVKVMSDDMKIVFKKIILRNKWLSPSTKKYALKKLKYFKFVFSKPENLREDPDLDYSTILYDNMDKIFNWRHNKNIELEGNNIIDIPEMDWTIYPVKMIGSQAYIVNASYTPAENKIYINLGYLQKPFVDLDERGIEYNIAHIGGTIAHEMGHGFDDWGSQYGHDGNLHNWWTDSDRIKYKKIQDDVIKQYEEFALRDGIKFDASISIGEDLADIQGLAVCDEYLRDFQEKNQDIVPIKNLSFEAFYTYFAYQQRQLVKKKALSAQLKTDPHPLDKYRCNIPLSRSQLFRAIYNVKKGDGMWWHNTNTVW
jgi:predicted metalloendopeptidase